jgi:hypothetical protein
MDWETEIGGEIGAGRDEAHPTQHLVALNTSYNGSIAFAIFNVARVELSSRGVRDCGGSEPRFARAAIFSGNCFEHRCAPIGLRFQRTCPNQRTATTEIL